MSEFLTGHTEGAVPLTPVTKGEYDAWLRKQPQRVRTWLGATGFKAKPGTLVRVPDTKLGVTQVVAGVEDPDSIWSYGDLAAKLGRSEEHTSELQSLMRISYAVLCWQKTKSPRLNSRDLST